MWRLWIFLGAAIWLITIGASATMNFLAGQSLGRTVVEGLVFAWIGLAADGWKALGPIFIAAFFRERKVFCGGIGVLVWSATVIFAIAAAIGFVSQNRQSIVGGRANLQATYDEMTQELARKQAKRALIGAAASVVEIEAEIAALLAQPAGDRGTVASISSDCATDTRRTRNECAAIANVRQGLARAAQASKLDREIATLRDNLGNMRNSGATLDSDPQSTLVSHLSLGWLPRSHVGMALILLFVGMVELISAFAPVVVSEYASVMRRSGLQAEANVISSSQNKDPIDDVREYLLARLEPTNDGAVSRCDMMIDFAKWCRSTKRDIVDADTFIQIFEHICREDFSERVVLSGEHYAGLRLASIAL